ncbi:hypothetical protein KP509_27G012400 [Ceratopteris richardii]|uniref:DUF868 domain-containing protein n=1 Tax=Ceratopteris richardii TaxID=49495 RepID=A0A8T2RE23_CERRI|nr:hypothetical protein KP509_27G012400 [Ceratopteris richardii]KAH7294669.1 hypothetical protein KP509_27G012400 [Ceratopteris richardii]
MSETAFPSWLGENAQHIQQFADAHHRLKAGQSSVTCLYQPQSFRFHKPVSITWSKGLLGQGFTVSIEGSRYFDVCKIDVKPWPLWKKQGSKQFFVEGKTFEILWDLSNAKYKSGPEPCKGFFVAVVCDQDIILLLGDMHRKAFKKTGISSSMTAVASLLSRKEHLYGRKVYHTRAAFDESGSTHDITIEYHAGADAKDPWMCLRVDKKAMVHINKLMWKFRGSQIIRVDGKIIEVFWDAYNWLFNPSNACAVFMFDTLRARKELSLEEKTKSTHSSVSVTEWQGPSSLTDKDLKQSSGKHNSFASILQWPNTHSFKDIKGCRDSSSGFSLFLYAWKLE